MSIKRKQAVAVILVREGKALLGYRLGWGGETWCFPAGHVEDGEALEACAAREVAEETGMNAGPLDYVGSADSLFPDRGAYTTHFFLGRESAGEAQVREPEHCTKWGWFPLAKLPSPLFHPANVFVAEHPEIFEPSALVKEHCETPVVMV